jgi:hypothetical protein
MLELRTLMLRKLLVLNVRPIFVSNAETLGMDHGLLAISFKINNLKNGQALTKMYHIVQNARQKLRKMRDAII